MGVDKGEFKIIGRIYPTCRQLKTWMFGRIERRWTQELEIFDEDDVEFSVAAS